MMALASEALMILAALVLGLLAIEVVSAMPRRGAWWLFLLWAAIGCGALAAAAMMRPVPLPVSLLVLALSLMLWRKRKRLVWAAKRGRLQ